MSDLWLHPALVMLAGCVLLPLVRGPLRQAFLLAVPLFAFVLVLRMSPGVHAVVPFAGLELTFGRVDSLSLVFAHIMTLMCLIGTLYGLHVREGAQHIAAWLYVTGSLGVIFAGDLFVLFIFWELMAVASLFLVWFRRTPRAQKAGLRYLLVHAFGGVVLLAGILLHWQDTGSLAFNSFDVSNPSTAAWLILFGFILNAAVPPLHAWLPDAYAEATVAGAVFMCAFTTKTAIYALCRGFAGLEILVPLGVIMTLYGVVYAVLENDVRRLLSYHIISQVGYMVAGVGIGTALAVNGAIAHAFAHILYKALLFMGVGAVLHMTGTSKATELGGLYRKMPWALFYTVVGGLSISGFPLLSGFVSKSMIVSAAFEDHRNWAAFLLMLASVGTFLSVGLKVPYAIWFGKSHCSDETWQKAKDPGWNMHGAMIIASALCLFIGVYTPYLYGMLPDQSALYKPYTAYHLAETLQVLGFTALGFYLFLKKLHPKAKISIDLDWFYRAPAPWLGRVLVGGVNQFFVWGGDVALQVADQAGRLARNPFQLLGRRGQPARDFDADLDRGPLSGPITLTLLLTVLVVAWTYWR